jgi:hypothetical protein
MSKKMQYTNHPQRPDTGDDRPDGVLFASEGQTGWGRVRYLEDYKQGKSEKNFHHLHDRFADPEDAA